MDWITGKDRILECLKKYRHIFLILLVGLFLMMLPESKDPEIRQQEIPKETSPGLQESLAEILSKISGAGEVEVLLTQSTGEETIYQRDENVSANDIHRETVLITNSEREECGLIQRIDPPVYCGAIVLCQGADNATIRLSIVEAVMSVTGLTSDHITVLKMK